MTGRGSGRLVRPSPDASVKIGLSLGVSSPALSPSSPEPFYIIVTARILTTPYPSQPVTLQTHPSALEGLSNRSFRNIACSTNPDKQIEISPRGWPQYRWDREDLRPDWSFVTIPPIGQGSYVVRHELYRDRILAANLQKGERYTVRLTDRCLGTRWWAFKSLDELEGVRLRTWKGKAEEQMEQDDPVWAETRERERRARFGDGPSCMGEDPEMLAMVVEGENAEFEIA